MQGESKADKLQKRFFLHSHWWWLRKLQSLNSLSKWQATPPKKLFFSSQQVFTTIKPWKGSLGILWIYELLCLLNVVTLVGFLSFISFLSGRNFPPTLRKLMDTDHAKQSTSARLGLRAENLMAWPSPHF